MPSEEESQECDVYIKGVPTSTSVKEFQQAVRHAIAVHALKITVPVSTDGSPRGYAFVLLKNAEDAAFAVEKLHKAVILGSKLLAHINSVVDYNNKREYKNPTDKQEVSPSASKHNGFQLTLKGLDTTLTVAALEVSLREALDPFLKGHRFIPNIHKDPTSGKPNGNATVVCNANKLVKVDLKDFIVGGRPVEVLISPNPPSRVSKQECKAELRQAAGGVQPECVWVPVSKDGFPSGSGSGSGSGTIADANTAHATTAIDKQLDQAVVSEATLGARMSSQTRVRLALYGLDKALSVKEARKSLRMALTTRLFGISFFTAVPKDTITGNVYGMAFVCIRQKAIMSRDIVALLKGMAIDGHTVEIVDQSDTLSPNDPFDDDAHTYRCKHCGRGFRAQYSLDQHYKDTPHMLNETRVCQYCHTTFDSQREAGEHEDEMHGEMIMCYFCGEIFRSKSSMEVHNRYTGHNLKGYRICGACYQTFPSTKARQQHENTSHGGSYHVSLNGEAMEEDPEEEETEGRNEQECKGEGEGAQLGDIGRKESEECAGNGTNNLTEKQPNVDQRAGGSEGRERQWEKRKVADAGGDGEEQKACAGHEYVGEMKGTDNNDNPTTGKEEEEKAERRDVSSMATERNTTVCDLQAEFRQFTGHSWGPPPPPPALQIPPQEITASKSKEKGSCIIS